MQYTSFKQIELDLKRLSLERQILVEELKAQKHQVAEDLKPYNWFGWAYKLARKYGALLVIKKIFK
ncbi:hypothetical protein [Cellulophaga omnivescoria]|uniref:hypothetical protein n=1 Tax=Cellulophaga omnivescoria TaxID=1888890 RepID=UPI001FE3EB1F|nr:hypothetical protein [Cellulophaga omnivescoria]WBU88394.1 hypothetical protein PBN93_10980 [Cellulophaga omnivescoria]WKB80374.1 hypothetical protein QYR09_11495 [Cellulophaga lytica]